MVHLVLETLIPAPVERAFDLVRDLDLHMASLAHTNERAVAGRTTGRIEDGETVTWKARHFGITWRLTSRITEFEPPRRFVDEQVRGPFAWFRHEHCLEPVPGGTRLVEDWRHEAPFGPLGRLADGLVLGRYMRQLFERRNRYLVLAAAREGGDGTHRA